MIRAIIIEDEKPALEMLLKALREAGPAVEVTRVLSSVREAIEFLETHPGAADLILSDVQLGDGLSFHIFEKAEVKTPVIFITGYDEFMMNAFEHNGIDYLLKPVDKKDLSKALVKFQKLKEHFSASVDQPLQKLMNALDADRKARLMVKRGIEFIPLRLQDIVLFYTENKVVYVIDRENKKYMSDKSLGDLEEELDPRLFFRANRQYIINIEYIKSYKVYEKLKLQVNLTLPEIRHSIIISQETAPVFKKWVSS